MKMIVTVLKNTAGQILPYNLQHFLYLYLLFGCNLCNFHFNELYIYIYIFTSKNIIERDVIVAWTLISLSRKKHVIEFLVG